MEQFIGEIRLFAGDFAPEGWRICDGSLLLINEYPALFSILGSTYGGDGVTTFGLPNFKGRIPVGTGESQESKTHYDLGKNGGTKEALLSLDHLPPHNHSIKATTDVATTGEPKNNFLATSNGNDYSDGVNLYFNLGGGSFPDGATKVALDADSVEYTGGSVTHSNMQPYVCLNYIIALMGIYIPT
jgi:microcystin-dependent protein